MPVIIEKSIGSIIAVSVMFIFMNRSDGQEMPFATLPGHLEMEEFADWIGPCNDEKGIYYFRRNFSLEQIPDSLEVFVSADPRYKIYVNGSYVGFGPALGDEENWHYESYDIGPFLQEGRNVIAAVVWNWKEGNGQRQITNRTAFILSAKESAFCFLNSGISWKVLKDPGYHEIRQYRDQVGGGYIAGSTDSLIGLTHPWEWREAEFSDADWNRPEIIGKGNHSGLDTWKGTVWKLKKRPIPMMEQYIEPLGDLVQTSIRAPDIQTFSADGLLEIPAHSKVRLLFDHETLTMGFPQFKMKGGKGGKVTIRYQETLFNPDGSKGDRNGIEGKEMLGYYDVIHPDGGNRIFEPLWIRVFRYVEVTVETDAVPLILFQPEYRFAAYPFEQKGNFKIDDPIFDNIAEACWRTVRLCALDTYMDCPYYEQIQYIGDTRIQGLISMVIAGDDRLLRNAILQFHQSMKPMGLTKSNHPSNNNQIIPPFTLLYIAMVHDFYMYRGEEEFIRQLIPGIQYMLEWFIAKIDDRGILGPLPYWNHVDGGTGFVNGSPPGISEGGSAHMTLLLAYAMDRAKDLMEAFGYDYHATKYDQLSTELKKQVLALCFDAEMGLIAETPEKDVFSQHTNIFAVLTGIFKGREAEKVLDKILNNTALIQTTLYFKHYLFEALFMSGRGKDVLEEISEWNVFIEKGLTTFPEHGLESRSDCHAWSAHPMFHFGASVCGIRPASAGYKTVKIMPSLGDLEVVHAEFTHPAGMIGFKAESTDTFRVFIIDLPAEVSGSLEYQGNVYPLLPGRNRIRV